MANLTSISYVEVAENLLTAGFQGWEVRMMGAICMAESGRIPKNHGLNDHDPTSVAYLSEDHGLLMINDYWGPLVLSPALLYPFHQGTKSFSQLAKDSLWNCKAGREMFLLRAYQKGYSQAYTVWNAYVNNKHVPFLPDATVAARTVGAI